MERISVVKYNLASLFLSELRNINALFLAGGDKAAKAMRKWDLEWPNIEASYSYTIAETATPVLASLASEYAIAAEYLLPMRLGAEAVVAWHHRGLVAARMTKNHAAQREHLTALGDAYDDLGRSREAIRYYNRSLTSARRVGDSMAIAHNLRGLGISADTLGNSRESVMLLRRALRYAREFDDTALHTEIIMHLAVALSSLRNGRIEAKARFREALRLSRTCNPRLRSAVLSNLGTCLMDWGDLDGALRCYRAGLRLSRSSGDIAGHALDLYNIADVEMKRGHFRRAINPLFEAARISKEQGYPKRRAEALALLGEALGLNRDYEPAIECLTTVLTLHRWRDPSSQHEVVTPLLSALEATGDGRKLVEIGRRFLRQAIRQRDRQDKSTAYGYLGLGFRILGKMTLALRFTKQALAVSRSVGNRDFIGADLCNLAMLLVEGGHAHRALPLLQEALSCSRQLRDKNAQGWNFNCLGAAYFRLGNEKRALGLLRRAARVGKATRDAELLGEASYHLGVVELARGDTNQSTINLRRALRVFGGNRWFQARINEQLANVFLQRCDGQRAIKCLRAAAAGFDSVGNQREYRRLQNRLKRFEEFDGQSVRISGLRTQVSGSLSSSSSKSDLA